jgi:threonine dehydratase
MTEPVRLPTAAEVDAARANIAGVARRTPLWRLDAEVPGMRIHLKLENLQPLGSFKIRAAVNAIKGAGAEAVRGGVVSASAGNFGQGIAWAAREMGAPTTIVVPEGSAATKAAALEGLGARVIRVPFDDWWQVLTTRRFEGAEGVFFHPVAECAVVAGNATIGAELAEDLANIDTVIVPFGGGGLVSGIGSVMRRLRPGTRMVVVESQASQPAAAALAAGRPTDQGPARPELRRRHGQQHRAGGDVASGPPMRGRGGVRFVRRDRRRHPPAGREAPRHRRGRGRRRRGRRALREGRSGRLRLHRLRRQYRRFEAGADPERRGPLLEP